MTYTFKLSRRLALVRDSASLAALALAAACGAGEPTGPTGSVSRSLALTPRSVTLEVSQLVAFQAYAKGTTDSLITAVQWTATGGTIQPDGQYSSSTTGDFRVIATRTGQPNPPSDTATVTVVAQQPNLAGISVSPDGAALGPGQQQLFTASGTLRNGSSAKVGVVWSASGGTIDAGGLYTAGPTAGTYRVVATSASLKVADTVGVTITSPSAPAPSAPVATASLPADSIRATAFLQATDTTARMVLTWWVRDTGYTSGLTFGVDSGAIWNSSKNPALTNWTDTVTVKSPPAGSSWWYWFCVVNSRSGLNSDVRCSRARYSRPGTITSPDPTPTPSPDPGYPNQPSGYTRIAEDNFTTNPPKVIGSGCTDPGVLAGCWWRWTDADLVTQDATAPQSASYVLQYTWPQGLAAGSGVGILTQGWASGSETNSTPYSRIYESGWIKIPSADFEVPSAGMKLLGYWGVGGWGTLPNQLYSVITASGGTTTSTGSVVASQFRLDIRGQGPISWSKGQNVSTTPAIVAGQWLHYEILMTLNDIGVANGMLRVWMNGVQTHNYSDVVYRTASAPSGFYARRWDPVWGGTGSATKTRADRLWLDHAYISGVQ